MGDRNFQGAVKGDCEHVPSRVNYGRTEGLTAHGCKPNRCERTVGVRGALGPAVPDAVGGGAWTALCWWGAGWEPQRR